MRRVLAGLLLLSATPAAAQTATVEGRVLYAADSSALSQATVRLGDESALTDRDGRFSVRGLPAGKVSLEVLLIGFTGVRDSLTLRPGEHLDLTVLLDAAATELVPPIVVEVDGEMLSWLVDNGYALRSAQGRALAAMTRDDLRMQDGTLADVLRRIPGVWIRRTSDYGSEIRFEPSPLPDGAPCTAGVYLNGSAVELGEFHYTSAGGATAMRPLRFDDLLRREEVTALELYGPADSPVPASDGCGALLLWSNELRPNIDEPFAGSIAVRLTDRSTGAPVTSASVRLQPGGLFPTRSLDGRFSFENVPPARYTLTVEVPGAPPYTMEVSVRAFGTVAVSLDVGG